MAVKTFTARDLNQRSSLVTQAVDEGYEVHITKHGRVVYRILGVPAEGEGRSVLEAMLELPDATGIDLERPDASMREVDL